MPVHKSTQAHTSTRVVQNHEAATNASQQQQPPPPTTRARTPRDARGTPRDRRAPPRFSIASRAAPRRAEHPVDHSNGVGTAATDAAAAALEEGVVRPSKMSKIDRTRGVIAAVVAAGERVRREAEHEDDDEEAFAKPRASKLVKDKGKIECVARSAVRSGVGVSAAIRTTRALPGGWETLAGMAREIRTLKELALLPLVYPEAFERLGVSPGRGVLLHGPPGTGKTAAVKALLGAAARGPRPVSFFSRKGADCLGKYMGEAERSLRLLFQEAERDNPSIVFFDEIDPRARAKSGGGACEGDAIHGSVVATLLALMDDSTARVGGGGRGDQSTGRRRPRAASAGSVRSLRFALPGPAARRGALRLHTRAWNPRPSERVIYAVAKRTEGAAGADLRALASAACSRRFVGERQKRRGGRDARRSPPRSSRCSRRRRNTRSCFDARGARRRRDTSGASLAQRGAEALTGASGHFFLGQRRVFPGDGVEGTTRRRSSARRHVRRRRQAVAAAVERGGGGAGAQPGRRGEGGDEGGEGG